MSTTSLNDWRDQVADASERYIAAREKRGRKDWERVSRLYRALRDLMNRKPSAAEPAPARMPYRDD